MLLVGLLRLVARVLLLLLWRCGVRVHAGRISILLWIALWLLWRPILLLLLRCAILLLLLRSVPVLGW